MTLSIEQLININTGVIHFVGIGGIGMSGIAEILHNIGLQVQGSDVASGDNIQRLTSMGIKVFIGHDISNIDGISVLVKSTAIKDTNPELIAARQKFIPIVKRAEMLAELMRLKISVGVAGTHGKTTTTSLIAAMFESAGKGPTVINGGIINTHGTNAYLGSGDYLIAEADESDETFIKVPSTIGVITNLDFYGSFDKLKLSFKAFIENLPFYGFGVLCNDHAEVRALMEQILDRKIITYGIESLAPCIKAVNIRTTIAGSDFDVEISDRMPGGARTLKNVHLPMLGIHNVLNSLAAISVAVELTFPDDVVINGFRNFQGVKRRFTKVGELEGITIIDDYAHHPEEIAVTLRTAKIFTDNSGGRIIAVVQPHRYSRVRDLFSEFLHCFELADIVLMAQIYSAGEEPLPDINSAMLVSSIKQTVGHLDVRLLDDPKDLAQIILNIARPKDMVLCLGAGNITNWAKDLESEMRNFKQVVA
jgi:UDP-N-acetylmuramate--alanine ligase